MYTRFLQSEERVPRSGIETLLKTHTSLVAVTKVPCICNFVEVQDRGCYFTHEKILPFFYKSLSASSNGMPCTIQAKLAHSATLKKYQMNLM